MIFVDFFLPFSLWFFLPGISDRSVGFSACVQLLYASLELFYFFIFLSFLSGFWLVLLGRATGLIPRLDDQDTTICRTCFVVFHLSVVQGIRRAKRLKLVVGFCLPFFTWSFSFYFKTVLYIPSLVCNICAA